jgi:glycosyltransferase 2 family protein
LARYKTLIKIAISAAFIAAVLHRVDVPAMLSALAATSAGYYGASFILLLFNSLVLAGKFRLLLGPSGIHRSLAALFRINLLCRFYAFFLTPAVGQGLVRWLTTTKAQNDRGRFITVMVLERTSFLFVLCLVVLLLQLTLSSPGTDRFRPLMIPLVLGGLAVTSMILIYLFAPRVNTAFNTLIGRIPKLGALPFARRIVRPDHLVNFYLSRLSVLATCLAIALLWHFVYLLRVYLLATAIGTPLHFLHLGWMASIVLLLQMIPITLNGIGLRESAYALLFSLASLPAEKGVLLGLLFLTQMLIVAAIGGIIAFFERG